jgi:hypothetical protein
MDVLIITDNITQNYNWAYTFNTIKRWIIYWLNENFIKNNFNSITIGKTYPEPKLIKLDKDNLNLANVIDLLDAIIIKKTEEYTCINIKYIIDMCSENNHLKSSDDNKIIIKNKNIIIEDTKSDNPKYSNIFIFSSILQCEFTNDNILYIKDCLSNDNIQSINWVNFSYKKILPNEPKLIETIMGLKHIDNYDFYIRISNLLSLNPNKCDWVKKDSNINDIFEKLFEIEFENYKKSHWSENPMEKNVSNCYFDYLESLNKNIGIDGISCSCLNFTKYCVNWIRTKMLANISDINFNIPGPKVNDKVYTEYVVEIIKFYELVYPKILAHHMKKSNKKYSFNLKKLNQLDFTDIKINNYPNDDSTNYLYSNTTMTNWKQEYENLNPFGLLIKYYASGFSYKGIYEHDILQTYPNMMISSISNNWLSLFDYYQLISADIDSSTKNKFNINEYEFIDNLHGNTNIILPLYINSEHWKLVKKYWYYHMSFINQAFEFDYVKKMDNIYFLTIIKTINVLSSTKCNQNIIRLFIYILRTGIQICIDNKYSYNNKTDYDKYFSLLKGTENLLSFNKSFVEYLIRVVQSILTSNISSVELANNFNKLAEIYFKHLINSEVSEQNWILIKAMSDEYKLKEIELWEEKYSLNILCFTELKKDLIFFSNLMNKIYSVKKFNQLIKFLDKNNGCLPILEGDFNCELVDSFINECVVENQPSESMDIDIKKIVISTGILNPVQI